MNTASSYVAAYQFQQAEKPAWSTSLWEKKGFIVRSTDKETAGKTQICLLHLGCGAHFMGFSGDELGRQILTAGFSIRSSWSTDLLLVKGFWCSESGHTWDFLVPLGRNIGSGCYWRSKVSSAHAQRMLHLLARGQTPVLGTLPTIKHAPIFLVFAIHYDWGLMGGGEVVAL